MSKDKTYLYHYCVKGETKTTFTYDSGHVEGPEIKSVADYKDLVGEIMRSNNGVLISLNRLN